MNILTIENISKSYSDKTLFENINLTVLENQKIAMVGINGTGKSTLLKIIAGLEVSPTGSITQMRNMELQYLAQTMEFDDQSTVLEHIFAGKHPHMVLLREYESILEELKVSPEDVKVQTKLIAITGRMDEENIWNMESEAKAILSKLGITQYSQPMKVLSGGQKRRVFLAATLIHPSDLLILDEPTNHLDDTMIQYLEEYLQKRKGATLMITHDRYFLDRIATRIIELDKGSLYSYEGNYTAFLTQKSEREELMQNLEHKRQRLFKQELEWMRTMPRARGTKQKARIGRFEQLADSKIDTSKNTVDIAIGGRRIGRKIINIEGISKSYGDLNLIEDYSYILQKEDRIGIIGKNGSGKTTLLNMISGVIAPDTGVVDVGETIKIGYFTQENVDMDTSLRVIDYIKETAEIIYTTDGSGTTASQMLERFLFPPNVQYSVIGKLSGGERKRLYLLKILMESPNVLLLDEPTNDLDIETLTILEDYIRTFNGPVITVSHDRYFLDKMATKILVTNGNGKVDEYYGNYTDYYDQVQYEQELEAQAASNANATANKDSHRTKNTVIKFTYKEQREYDEIDGVIEKLEEKISMLDPKISSAGSDFVLLQDLMKEKEGLELELEEVMDRWVYLHEIAEQIEEQKKGK
ncbi:MAG TPA: ABC-F family ATP-binding cassette domain-containing protein [Epulopiscium sp.]|nr:ABC-F family ATP-binding cassette domain-containing protein [Candidatus Epulonipiscium sp.]